MNKMKLIVPVLATLFATAPAAAQTVGNPATLASVVDTCAQCTFVLNQAFGVTGAKVGTYNFYANGAEPITPLLLTRVNFGSSATFTVVGVGTQRTAVLGFNSFDFGLAQGTNVTTAASYFGFAYTNGGVVGFNYIDGTGLGTFVGPSGYTGGLGTSFTDDFSTQPVNAYDALDARKYSINATAVPEPATWAMMLLGFVLVGFGLRSRRRQAVGVAYA